MLEKWSEWVQHLSVSRAVAESLWEYPTLGLIHLYSMVFLMTVIAALDLRLMGIAMDRGSQQPLPQLTRRVLGFAWMSLGVNAVTGTLLFMSRATEFYSNSAFQIKILLVFLGMVYHSIVFPTIVLPRATRWDESSRTPIGAKLMGVFSLLLWAGVVVASQWIG